MKTFLLEVGTEEIPPSFLAPAAAQLERRLRALLAAHDIAAGPAEVFYTPRRLALRLTEVAGERPARVIEVQGPPARAAFGPDGKPTKTALGFARAQGRAEQDIFTRKTAKGEYAFVRKEEPALPAARLLSEELPGVIAGLPFPKTMRWREDKTRFCRPIRRLLCLFGTEVIRFELAGLVSADLTQPRRGVAPLRITDPAQYEAALREHAVIVRPDERRTTARAAIETACAKAGGWPVLDEELLEETVNTTELPVPILCRFDPQFLTLPAEVLITALKKHQRSFAVRGPDDKLLPLFVAIADTPGCDETAVGRWYEQAVESRLRDARFFFEQDAEKTLARMAEELSLVTWIDELGTYHDKTARLVALAPALARPAEADADLLARAARLAKADLVSAMVREKEFTSLQGVMGGIYARLAGEPDAVCSAIAEHYRPVSTDDAMPNSLLGALLSLADKLDNVVAAYALDSAPTGSEDPFAIRRQAWGAIAMILRFELAWLDLETLLAEYARLYPDKYRERIPAAAELLKERLSAILAEQGIPYDLAAAVIDLHWRRPVLAAGAARALLKLRKSDEFERLIIGQKRVANILKGQKVTAQPDPDAFAEPAERELWDAASRAAPDIAKATGAADFETALTLLLELRRPIDRLFDDVLVMAEDERIRANRLALLSFVRGLFHRVADLSRIVIEGEPGR